LGSGAYGAGGSPLPESIRRQAEPQFSFDFSRIKVHTDEAAIAANRGLQSRAFTVGEHIHFGKGEFRPANPAGQQLLAHELTHVVQQSRGGAEPGLGEHSALEEEARGVALEYGHGPVRVEGSSGIGVARAPNATVDVSKLSPDALEKRAQMLSVWFDQHMTDDPAYADQLQAAVDLYQAMFSRDMSQPYPLDTEALKSRLVAKSPRTVFELEVRQGKWEGFGPVYKDGVVIAYLHPSSGDRWLRDVNGETISRSETPLESPLLDPIDLIPVELLGSLVAKAGMIGLRSAARVGAKLLAKDVAKVGAEEAAKLGAKELAGAGVKTGVKEVAKTAGKAGAEDLAKGGTKEAAKVAGKVGAEDAAKTGTKALVEVFRKGAKFRSVGATSLKRLRNVLGRAGVSPSGYKLVKVSAEVSRAMEKEAGETIWGWVSRDGAGTVARDLKGRPIINFTERALSSLEEAVKTFGHEAKHLQDFARGLEESSEALAELAGEKLWLVVQETLGK